MAMTYAERDTARIQREWLAEQREAALKRHLTNARHKSVSLTCPVCVGIASDRPWWR